MFVCTSKPGYEAMAAERLSKPANGQRKSPITGAIKDPITKFYAHAAGSSDAWAKP
jgi:hypothetical protein